MGVAVAAVGVEVATMLPFLGAIGLLTAHAPSTPVALGLLAAYCLVMIAPALALLVLRLVASRDARDGSVKVHADADLYATLLGQGEKAEHAFAPGRIGWVQVARGAVTVNGTVLKPGDGAQVSDETKLDFVATEAAEVLLFDLA